LLLGISQ